MRGSAARRASQPVVHRKPSGAAQHQRRTAAQFEAGPIAGGMATPRPRAGRRRLGGKLRRPGPMAGETGETRERDRLWREDGANHPSRPGHAAY